MTWFGGRSKALGLSLTEEAMRLPAWHFSMTPYPYLSICNFKKNVETILAHPYLSICKFLTCDCVAAISLSHILVHAIWVPAWGNDRHSCAAAASHWFSWPLHRMPCASVPQGAHGGISHGMSHQLICVFLEEIHVQFIQYILRFAQFAQMVSNLLPGWDPVYQQSSAVCAHQFTVYCSFMFGFWLESE